MAELKRCIYNTVNIVLQSNMYEGAVSYLDQFDDLDTYLVVKIKRSEKYLMGIYKKQGLK